MFNWLYVDKDLQNNYDVLLKEFNKLTNQNLRLIDDKNDLIREVAELNDVICMCNRKYEEQLQKEQDMNKIIEELKKNELIRLEELKKNELIRLEQYDYYHKNKNNKISDAIYNKIINPVIDESEKIDIKLNVNKPEFYKKSFGGDVYKLVKEGMHNALKIDHAKYYGDSMELKTSSIMV